MANTKKRSKLNIPMSIACVLLCLTLISVHLTSGLYAKYITSASGGDSARVIKFGNITITETGDFVNTGEMIITPGVDLKKEAVVDFGGSEAATYVFLKVSLAGGWTTTDNKNFSINNGAMSWGITGDWNYLTKDTAAGYYVYYQELDPNEAFAKEPIIAGNKVIVSPNITESDIAGMTGITVSFQATAVQSNGFSDVNAAWTSVSTK